MASHIYPTPQKIGTTFNFLVNKKWKKNILRLMRVKLRNKEPNKQRPIGNRQKQNKRKTIKTQKSKT